MLTATASYRVISENLTRTLETTAKRPDVARQTEYYRENIGNVKSIDDFLSDERLFRYAMKAHGLEDMAYAKAFMRKVLEEGVDDDAAFANKLSDKRYHDFAESFNFQRYGTSTTSFERTQQGTIEKYARQVLEEDAGAQNEAVRLALYFQRKAPNIETVYELLADPALLKVTQVLLGLSESTGALDIDKQAAFFENRLDIEDFKDAEKLSKLLTRFTSMWEAQNAPAAANNAALLIGGGVMSFGISGDLLASIQGLKLGGN